MWNYEIALGFREMKGIMIIPPMLYPLILGIILSIVYPYWLFLIIYLLTCIIWFFFIINEGVIPKYRRVFISNIQKYKACNKFLKITYRTVIIKILFINTEYIFINLIPSNN